MKNIKTKLETVLRLMLALITFVTSFSYVVPVFAESSDSSLIVPKSEIIKSTVASTTEELKNGEVKLEKSISKVNETTYNVSLTATGKDKEVSQATTANIYAVIVFDNSDSMASGFCMPGIMTCKKGDKYNNAMSGAINFSSILTTNFNGSQVALVTFSADASLSREFADYALTSNDFPNIGALTDIYDGIDMATSMLLNKKKDDSTAKLYMIIIGDGVPTVNEGKEITRANEAKDEGIEIFSIGYDVAKNRDAEKTLKALATDANHYENASIDSISATISNIVGNIKVNKNAGTNATITDSIGEKFTYVDGSAKIGETTAPPDKVDVKGQTISFDVGNITEEGVTVSFQIKLNTDSLTPGNYPTNDSASVDYTNPEGLNPEGPEITIDESPEIKWAPEYKYTINYYKDEVKLGNELGNPITDSAVAGTKITVDENLRLEEGYVPITENLDFNVSENGNTVNIVYTKRTDLTYTVNYYKDSTDGELIDSTTIENQTFGDKIEASDIDLTYKKPAGYKDGIIETTMPYTIKVDGNVIDVVYTKKDDLSYVVEYYKDSEKTSNDSENTVTDQVYGSQITVDMINKDKYKPGFGYQSGVITTTMPHTIIDGTNTIKVCYYRRTDLSYTVKYLEKDTNASIGLTDEVRTNKTALETYIETAKDAPFGYKLVGNNTQNITLDADDKVVTFYYEKKEDFSYKVNYLEEGTDKELAPSVTKANKLYNSTHEEEAIEITGYNLVGDSKQNITLDEYNKEITFYYTKRTDLTYTVNYYKDSTAGELLDSKTVQNQTFGDEIEASDIDVTYKKPAGYKNGVIETTMPYTIKVSGNIIEVVYTKKDDLSYVVEYYKDNEKVSNDAENTVTNQIFGSQVTDSMINKDKYKPTFGYQSGVITTTMPYTIIDGTNTIKVCYYKREDLSYTVKYLEKDTDASIGLTNEVRTNKTALETYTETAKDAPFGYKLVGENTQNITLDADDKVVTFYYEKKEDFSYKVNYLEEGTDKELAASVTRENKLYNSTHEEEAIEITGYNLVGDSKQRITLDEYNKEITFYYTKRTDLSYTVNYYKDNTAGEVIGTDVIENQIFESTITEDDLDLNKYKPVGYKDGVLETILPYTIKVEDNTINIIYIKKDDLTYRVEYYYDGDIDSSKTDYFEGMTFGEVIYTYTEKLPKGYKYVKDTAPLTIEDSEDNVIRVYYEELPQGEIIPPNTGMQNNNYSLIYLFLCLGLVLITRKQED